MNHMTHQVIYPHSKSQRLRATEFNKENITNWGKLVLQIGAALFYYKLGQGLLQIGAAITN